MQVPTAAFHRLLLISRVRLTESYARTVRDLGCVWFFLLATAVAYRQFAQLKSGNAVDFVLLDWVNQVINGFLVVIYFSFSWFILHRPTCVARTEGILPSIAAFAGTYLPWSFVLLAPSHESRIQDPVALLFLLVGTGAAVVIVFYLGKSFSLVPQAHRLVREGPYSVVRNPLYLAEEVALLGVLMKFFSPLALALFIAHGALQVARILFEESLLRRTFPNYDDYARSTPRVIPYVW